MLEFLTQLNNGQPLTALVEAYRRSLAAQETERRKRFEGFGLAEGCACPASAVFHQHSRLSPSWQSPLTGDEATTLTRNLAYKQYEGAPRVSLSQSKDLLDAPLETVIRERRSKSNFTNAPIAEAVLSKLLQLGCGVTRAGAVPLRAAPSGGALYPVETYPFVFSVDGVDRGRYHYAPLEHALERIGELRGAEDIWHVLYQGFDGVTPAVAIVLTACLPRTQAKYAERGYRFALMESGHIAQNLLLTATAFGLSAVGVGGFFDDALNFLVGIDGEREVSVYIVLIGPGQSN